MVAQGKSANTPGACRPPRGARRTRTRRRRTSGDPRRPGGSNRLRSVAADPCPFTLRVAAINMRTILVLTLIGSAGEVGPAKKFGGFMGVRANADEATGQLMTWLWRVGVGATLVASSFRSGGLGSVWSGVLWYALQFGPLLILVIVQASRLSLRILWSPRTRLLVVSMVALAVMAGLSALWSLSALETLRQAGIFAVCTLFFLTTLLVRWTSSSVLYGDLASLFWCGLAIQAVGLFGYLTGQPWAVGQVGRFTGVTPNPNYAGTAAALLIALAFTLPGRSVKIAASIPLLALLLSGSRGALVGLIAGVILLFVTVPASRRSIHNRVLALFSCVILPLMFLFVARVPNWIPSTVNPTVGPSTAPGSGGSIIPDEVTSGRLEIYRAFIEQWTRTPVLGIGYRSSGAAQAGLNWEAHNIYLSVLVELGGVGVIVFIAVLVGLWQARARRSAAICAAAAVLVSELFESSLFGLGGPTAILSWIVLFAWASTGTPGPHGRSAGGVASQPS